MHIAYLVSQYPATSHTFVKREVAALRRRGIIVSTFSVRPPATGDLSPDTVAEAQSTFTILRQGVLVFVWGQVASFFRNPLRFFKTLGTALTHRPPGARALALSLAYFAEAIVLASALRRTRVDHLHAHFANSGATVGLLAAKHAGISWSFVIHGPSETDYPAGYLLGAKVRAAQMVVCVSWFAKSQAMRLVSPHHWGKFKLVHCGLELDRLAAISEERNENTIICVGRLCSDKAQAGLLEAFAHVRSRFPETRLKFVGDGPDRQILERRAQDLGIQESVEFLGSRPESETLRLIASAGLMVLPSFWEGLPVVLMEAMALKTPVIAARVAGTPELIVDGDNGLLFAPANWTELAAAIERMLGDVDLRTRLAKRGLDAVEAEFNVDGSAARLERYFTQVLSPAG